MTPFEASWVDFKCCTKHLFKCLFLQFLLCFHVYIPEDMLMCSCFYSFSIFLHCTLHTKILRKERGKEPNKSKDARTGVLLISPVCFSLDPLKFSFLSFIFHLRDPLVFDNAATLQGKPLLIHIFNLEGNDEWWGATAIRADKEHGDALKEMKKNSNCVDGIHSRIFWGRVRQMDKRRMSSLERYLTIKMFELGEQEGVGYSDRTNVPSLNSKTQQWNIKIGFLPSASPRSVVRNQWQIWSQETLTIVFAFMNELGLNKNTPDFIVWHPDRRS